MVSARAIPQGYNPQATEPARNNSEEAKTSIDDVDVDLYANSSSSSLAMSSGKHSLGTDDLESNLRSSSLATDAENRSTNTISNTNNNNENADSDANLQTSFPINSVSESSIEDHSLERTTAIRNTESSTMNYYPGANGDEDVNGDVNGDVNANDSSNTDMPMVAVTFLFIIGYMMLSVVNAVFQLNHFRLVSMYGLTAIVILGALFFINWRRRDTTNLHTDVHDDNDDDRGKFPADSYSFVALYSPKTDPDLFCFGLLVYVFQASLFFLMISSVVHPSLHSTGGVDNPDAEFDSSSFAAFIPSNVSPIVRATQIIAVLTFLIFPEASFLDVSTGISMFPQLWKMYGNEQVWCMAFACVLRSIQGFMAIFATVVLIMSSSDVTQIVLSLIAVNFISLLDDTAFKSARAGTYGSLLEKAAKRIENEPIPSCSGLEHKYPRYQLSVYVIGVFMLVLLCFVIFSQEDSDKWITRVIQVKFGGSEDIHLYDGCYDVALDLSYNKRHNYKLSSDDIRVNQTQIGYCRDDRKWVLFNSVLDNPCQAEGNQLVAHSSKTDSFDVSTSFGDTWYSGSNEPLLLVLEELRENPKDCRSYLGDGICDEFFNKPVYEFDGGDCCATTCSHLNCGKGGLNYAPVFGTKIALDRFPNCKDPSMKPVTIGLNSISISDLETNPIVNFICDGNDVLSIPVDQSIEDYTETVMVPREGSCMFKPELEVKGFEWELCYTVSSEGTDISYEGCISWKRWIKENFFVYNVFDQTTLSSNIGELLRGSTSLILDGSDFTGTFPSEIGLLTELTELSLSGNTFSGTIPSEIGFLTELNTLDVDWNTFTGPLPSEIGMLTKLEMFHLYGNIFTGTLPSEIGLMKKFSSLDLYNNAFTGTLPSEIAMMTNLNYMNLYDNAFTGTIRSDIGLMTRLFYLNLHNNDFTGTIPSEIGSMTKLYTMRLAGNALTGTIPSEIGLLTGLDALDLTHNSDFSGTLPSEMGLLTNLLDSILDLGGTKISGPVPEEIGVPVVNIWEGTGEAIEV
uniref:LNR domain-containing protein n=1 Tax=Pseudo-nitzschia australis TaxID=44445 RepID=A0A7S4EP40_9STRA